MVWVNCEFPNETPTCFWKIGKRPSFPFLKRGDVFQEDSQRWSCFLFLMFILVSIISSLAIIHNVVYDFNCVYKTGFYTQMCPENQHQLVLPVSQCKQWKAGQHIKTVPLSSLPLPALIMCTAGHGLGSHFTCAKSSWCQASPSSNHSQDSAANYDAPLWVFEGVYWVPYNFLPL